ncbi:hypothetical protein [Jatrophihabitans fulvus]
MQHRRPARLAALVVATLLVLLGVATRADARPGSRTYATLAQSSITLGQAVAIRSAVTPNQSGRSVYLQKHTRSGWVTLQHRYLNGASRHTFSLRPGSSGDKYLRVYFKGRAARAGSLSRTVVLHVRPKPSSGGGGGGGTGGGSCTSGYSPCIPIGSDVDCEGGSGNGPRYVSGPIYVTGSDPYDLDRDGDGIACES